MPRDERRRQKALARKASRRKGKKADIQRAGVAGHASLRMAAQWPLYECLLSDNWREPGELVQVLVARRRGDEIAAAGILVDLGCLGVKDALHHLFFSGREYEEFQRMFTGIQSMSRADLDLAVKIIEEGIAYAQQLGFSPHRDYNKASVLLAGANPAACDVAVPVGDNGKPLYIMGPHDNPDKVLRQLERTVGPGNYHYLLGAGDLLVTDMVEDEAEEPEDRSTSFLPGLLRRRRS